MNNYAITAVAAALLLVSGSATTLQVPRPLRLVAGAERSPTAPVTVLSVDVRQSVIRWRGTKLFRTASHEGTLGLKEGYLRFENDSLVGGRITADMNTIRVTDIPPHERTAIRNLTEHLKSDFDTRAYPLATFEITHVRYLGGDSLRVRGNMTIKGVTRSISVPASTGHSEGTSRRFRTAFSLNRFEWNVGADGSWLARRLVDADFELEIRLVATENVQASG